MRLTDISDLITTQNWSECYCCQEKLDFLHQFEENWIWNSCLSEICDQSFKMEKWKVKLCFFVIITMSYSSSYCQTEPDSVYPPVNIVSNETQGRSRTRTVSTGLDSEVSSVDSIHSIHSVPGPSHLVVSITFLIIADKKNNQTHYLFNYVWSIKVLIIGMIQKAEKFSFWTDLVCWSTFYIWNPI